MVTYHVGGTSSQNSTVLLTPTISPRIPQNIAGMKKKASYCPVNICMHLIKDIFLFVVVSSIEYLEYLN